MERYYATIIVIRGIIMKKFIKALLVVVFASMLLVGCVKTEPDTWLEQTNEAVIVSVWQNCYGDVYVEVGGIPDTQTNIGIGYSIGEEAPGNWNPLFADVPSITFDNINKDVGLTIKLYTRLEADVINHKQYKESTPSVPYNYKIKNIYDTQSEWYRSKTTFKDTYAYDGKILRDIAQSGIYEMNCWDYMKDETLMFFDNIYYLNASGLSLILKKLTVTQNGDNYYYTLFNPDIKYEYALIKDNQASNIVWHAYSSLTGIIFEDADRIKLRISGNSDYCESIDFLDFDVQSLLGEND